MECPHCGSEWSIWELDFEEEFEYPDKCPFCGCSRTAFADDSAHILKQILEQRGMDILQNRKALAGFVADLMHANPIEQTTLKIVIGEGVGEFFYKMIDADINCINVQKHKVVQLITEIIGMSSERAEFVIKTFMFALGLEQDALVVGTKEKSFHDRDNAYFDLAEKFLDEGKIDLAEKLFYLSSNTGNISAIHRTILLVRNNNWKPNDEEWLEWHKTLADTEEDNFESAYILAMSYTHGLGVGMDIDIARHYWVNGRNYNASATIEYIVGQFVDNFPIININITFSRLRRLALRGDSLAKEIYDFIEDTGDGIDGWKQFFANSDEVSDIFYDAEYYNNQKFQMALMMGDYYSLKIKEEHKHTDFDYENISMTWYIIATRSDEDEIRLSAAKKMLSSSWNLERRFAVGILEQIKYSSEANYLVGLEYFKGECVEKDYSKAYVLINNGIGDECDYLLGQLNFYGWGIDANVNAAIECFEKEAKEFALHNPDEVNDEFILSKCVPFLIHCYYEDLVLRDSVSGLEKLKLLADYHGWKNAARFLYWYFSDRDNLYQDPVEARHYYNVMNESTNMPTHIDDCHKQEIFEVALKCIGIENYYIEADFTPVKDHILWCHGESPVKMGNLIDAMLGGSPVKSYYYMAVAFAQGIGVSKNKLRAETYARLYIELTEGNPDKEIYPKALRLMVRLLEENPTSLYRKKLAANYMDRVILYEYKVESTERKVECLKAAMPYVDKGDLKSALPYMEEAVENGYNKNYSFIGFMYMSDEDDIEIDYDKGFLWLKRFYDDYRASILDLDEDYDDIAQVEYILGTCYSQGLGTEVDETEAIKLWELALEHCPDRRQDIIITLSLLFYKGEGEFDRNGKTISIKKNIPLAFAGFSRAAGLGSSKAMFYLGQIYENGDYGWEPNMETALEWYQRAKEAGDTEAEECISNLPDEIEPQNLVCACESNRKLMVECDSCHNKFYYEFLSINVANPGMVNCKYCNTQRNVRIIKKDI